MMPVCSAGSNQVGASDTCTAKVICPAGACATAGPGVTLESTITERIGIASERAVMDDLLWELEASSADRRDSLGQLRLELTGILERAKPLDFSDRGGDVPRDPPPLGRAPSERHQRLLALDGVLHDVRREAVKAKPDVDV